MMRNYLMLMLIGCILTVEAFGQPKEKQKTPLFTVGSWPTYADEFEYLFNKNNSKNQVASEASIDEYLELIINFKLKVAAARLQGLDTTVDFRKEYVNYRDDLSRPFTAKSDKVEMLAKEAYERMKWEVRAAHLLIMLRAGSTPEDTLDAYGRISSLRERVVGGENFFEVAGEYSEDPSAKVNKGDLGYFSALQMVYPFEQAVYALEVGQVSPIIKTSFGYHIIKLLDKRLSWGQVEVSHIMIKHSGQGDQGNKRIMDIRRQLDEGASWDDLCSQYSEDEATNKNGGRLQAFSSGVLSNYPKFEQAAFSLTKPGEISEPVQTRAGWHLIRLEKKIMLQPYEEMAENLKQRIRRDARLKMSEEEEFKTDKERCQYKPESKVLDNVLQLADSSLLKGSWQFTDTQGLSQKTLFALGDQKFTVKDFVIFVRERQDRGFGSPTSYMQHLFDTFVKEKIGDLDEARLVKENQDFRNLLREYKEGILLFAIMENEVWQKASSDSVGQRNYYNNHLDQFQVGERLNARVMQAVSLEALEKVKIKILAGDTLNTEDMKAFTSVAGFQFYAKGDSPAVDAVKTIPGVYYPQIDGVHYLVEVANLVPAGAKSFEESRSLVISKYQDELEKKWLEQLKIKLPVRVNKKQYKKIVESLTAQHKSANE